MLNALLEERLQEQEHEGFKVTDLQSATWCFRKLKAIKQAKEENQRVANEEIKNIQEWLNNENVKLQDSENFFESLLAEYYKTQKQVDPKFKVSTPYGKVSSRKLPDKWEYDETVTIPWLKANNPSLIRIKEEVNKEDLKKVVIVNGKDVVTEDGEIIPGITVEKQPESIKIEVI